MHKKKGKKKLYVKTSNAHPIASEHTTLHTLRPRKHITLAKQLFLPASSKSKGLFCLISAPE
jgi:hypothetical protein